MALKFAVNNSLSEVTSLPTAIPTGSMTLLQTQTASSSSTIDFTSNIDSTYDVYVFKFIDIHPSSASQFEFQGSTNGGSSYGVTITSTTFSTQHDEGDSSTNLNYAGGRDLAQSTSFQSLTHSVKTDNDSSTNGTLQIFNPSSTTFVKHWISTFNFMNTDPGTQNVYHAGYFNTTSAINGIQFKFNSGNIDSGVIKLYGIS
tara:strand:- start:39 stop:641 length:603 start_codon:yes stop_codon:yes gene_type:complete